MNQAVSPYHAARTVADRLRQAGYIDFREEDPWELAPGQRLVVQRAGASLVALEMGRKPPSDAGFIVIGAHTDSPNLRLKPHHELRSHMTFGVSVEPYGGLLLHTWLDRPLAVAGRLVLDDGTSTLIHIPRGILTLPSLAIHLQRDTNTQGLVVNPQQHLRPLLGLDLDADAAHPFQGLLAEALSMDAALAGAQPSQVLSSDICLLDATTASVVGHEDAFIQSGRLDNLVSAYAALEALLDAGEPTDATRVLVLYDHEEVGSRSFAGAQSTLLGDVLERVARSASPRDSEAHFRAMARSMLLSADMAHAVHPNHADKHDDLNRPRLGLGPVLKFNAGQSYATDSVSAAALMAAATRANVNLQRFVTRSDMPCGSTIGPLAASRQGLRTVDVGAPMLAMHSSRELCASADILPYAALMTEWYRMVVPHGSHH